MSNGERLKVATIMNFVRQCEPRDAENDKVLFDTTRKQLEFCVRSGKDHTFLLQYDTLCDDRYIELFNKKATKQTEVGLWFEIVEPLTSKVGLEYRSEYGWKWDWHIIPGFSMAYKTNEREMLIDEAMRKFKERFGEYPRTVGSWLIDTHTVNYLTEHYDIDALCIYRDQTNTDAYTLVGGYFNQAYYPSKNNMFTPAQSAKYRINTPVFRLLGPDPIHNYDGPKYGSPEKEGHVCWTLEAVWDAGKDEKMAEWYFNTYYENEDLGFSYAQLGQENSFGLSDLVTPLKMQLSKLDKHENIKYLKMKDAGRAFRERYPKKTPATCVAALDNWDSEDIQSVYYDSQNYTANIFRHGKKLFFRSFYLFDEKVPEHYIEKPCKTFYAVYENLPIVDTVTWAEKEMDAGMTIDECVEPFTVSKSGKTKLKIKLKDRTVVKFSEDRIEVDTDGLVYDPFDAKAKMKVAKGGEGIEYEYNGAKYFLRAQNAKTSKKDGKVFVIKRIDKDAPVALIPERR